MYCHWKEKVEIIKEVPKPPPRFDQFRMHMHASRIFNHRKKDKCNRAMER